MNKDAGRGGFLFVTLRLEDGAKLPFIVDTGSPATYLSKSLESKLGNRLGTWTFSKYGKQTSGRYPAPRLYLGNTMLMTGANIFTFDFTQLSSRSGHPIMGVLGLDCLRHYCIQLDFETGTLRFLGSNRVDTAHLGKAFPLTFSSLNQNDTNQWDIYPLIDQSNLAGGNSAGLVIDTGCNIDGLVERGAAKEQATRLPEVVWDEETYTNIHVGIERINALGLRFLARHLVTFDFPHDMMYLKQTSVGPLLVEKKDNMPTNSMQPAGKK